MSKVYTVCCTSCFDYLIPYEHWHHLSVMKNAILYLSTGSPGSSVLMRSLSPVHITSDQGKVHCTLNVVLLNLDLLIPDSIKLHPVISSIVKVRFCNKCHNCKKNFHLTHVQLYEYT